MSIVVIAPIQAQVTFKGPQTSSPSSSSSSSSPDLKGYSFFLSFPEECVLSSKECAVSVTENNVVMVLVKGEESHHQWQQFNAGLNSYQTEVSCTSEWLLSLHFVILTGEAISHWGQCHQHCWDAGHFPRPLGRSLYMYLYLHIYCIGEKSERVKWFDLTIGILLTPSTVARNFNLVQNFVTVFTRLCSVHVHV